MSSFSSDFEDAYALPFDSHFTTHLPPNIPHPLHSISAPLSLKNTFQKQPNSSLHRLCKNFIRGGCDVPECRFFHPTPIELVVHASEIARIYAEKYGKIEICKDFLNGKCERFQCKYKHCDEYWKGEIERFNLMGEAKDKFKFKLSTGGSGVE